MPCMDPMGDIKNTERIQDTTCIVVFKIFKSGRYKL